MDNPFAPDYREPESDDAPSTITLANGNTVAGTPSEHITYHKDLIQGSDEWLAQRCGVLTASELRQMIDGIRDDFLCDHGRPNVRDIPEEIEAEILAFNDELAERTLSVEGAIKLVGDEQ